MKSRWLVTVTYRSRAGELDVEYDIEELDELQDLVERGPDWNCITNIAIRLNPGRASYVRAVEDTVSIKEG